jgi:hypothetical protein
VALVRTDVSPKCHILQDGILQISGSLPEEASRYIETRDCNPTEQRISPLDVPKIHKSKESWVPYPSTLWCCWVRKDAHIQPFNCHFQLIDGLWAI